MNLRLSISCILLFLFAAKMHAQEVPGSQGGSPRAEQGSATGKPEGQQKPAGDPQEKKEPAAEGEAKPDPPARFTVVPGWATHQLSGNRHRFLQYATPPHGAFLQELRFDGPILRDHSTGLLSIKTPGEDDFRFDGQLRLLHGWTRAEGLVGRNRFFDVTPTLTDRSQRRVDEFSVKQLITPSLSMAVNYRMDTQDQAFEAPRFPLHQRTRLSGAVVEGKVGPGFLSVGLTDWRFFDRTMALPDSKVQRVHASYLLQPVPNIGIEGSYNRYNIHQAGRAKSRIEISSIVGDAAVGPDTDLSVSFRRDRRDSIVTQNAYIRDRMSGGVSLVHRWPGWSAQVGVRQREAERIRGDQTFVDVPKWTTVDGRLSGRITRDIRLTLRGASQTLTSRPPMITDDPRPLFWDRRNSGSISLNGVFDTVSAYAAGSWHRMENSTRSSWIEDVSATLGANWEAKPQVGVFAELTWEDWSARSESTGFPTLGLFASDVQSSVIGVNWAIDPFTTLWAAFTYFETSNRNPLLLPSGNTTGTMITFNLSRRIRSGEEIGLVLAPWRYSDSVRPVNGFNSTVLIVTGRTRF